MIFSICTIFLILDQRLHHEVLSSSMEVFLTRAGNSRLATGID